ncbi:MAG: reverse transcriptase-like protein [Acidobacteriota bacterium]
MRIFFAIQCEPNPGGPSFAAMIAYDDDGNAVFSKARYLGCGPEFSNNSTAYRALIRVLRWVKQSCSEKAIIFTDQEILTKQISGEWECRSDRLRPLLDEAKARLAEIEAELRYIPARENHQARILCRLAANQARREEGKAG